LGNVTGVSATISNFGHTYPEDVALVLKSPTGADTVLMNGCGLDFGVNGLNLTFSQNASSPLPQSSALTSGTYLPTSYATVILPETNGAPVPPYPVTMTNFYGQSPNGAWALYAADENQQDSGYISNGWSLTFITGLPVEDDSDLELAMTLSPSAATLNNPLTYTISVTNYGPSIATNVIITDTLPGGATYVSNSCNCTAGTNGVLTFSAGTLAVSNGVTFSFEVIPTALGNLTNIAAAIANEPDPNSNNIQTNITQVSQPIANLTVDITASPNPVLDGGSVTYIITVTNNGPSQATGTMATNVLPVGFLPISITPSTGTTTNVNGTIYWNIGTLGSVTNSSATMTIVAGVNLPENILPTSTNLDMVTVGSLIAETTKTGNFAAVKTEVQPAMITVSASGKIYTLSWPATPGNIVLQGSVKLPPTWVNITNSSIVSQVVGGQTNMTYTLPGTNGYHFFRLMSHLP
jgi:uncharacterized repeat protein (TIGR01451 family)